MNNIQCMHMWNFHSKIHDFVCKKVREREQIEMNHRCYAKWTVLTAYLRTKSQLQANFPSTQRTVLDALCTRLFQYMNICLGCCNLVFFNILKCRKLTVNTTLCMGRSIISTLLAWGLTKEITPNLWVPIAGLLPKEHKSLFILQVVNI